jgi:alcohol dehydrogenase-like protein
MRPATTARGSREPRGPLYSDPVHHAPTDPTLVEAPDGSWRMFYTQRRADDTGPGPVPGPDEVLIAISAVGICGSDLHAYNGSHPFRRPPLIVGHVPAGYVARVGAGVRGFSTGDPVLIEPLRTCGPAGRAWLDAVVCAYASPPVPGRALRCPGTQRLA